MENKELMREDGSWSKAGFVDWATMGMPETLGPTIRGALMAIAATGECCGEDEEWILFGKVTDGLDRSPPSVMVRRTNMMMNFVDPVDDRSTFELSCEVEHPKVDLAAGARVGVQVDALFLWNLPLHHRGMPWNVTHLFSGAYEGCIISPSRGFVSVVLICIGSSGGFPCCLRAWVLRICCWADLFSFSLGIP